MQLTKPSKYYDFIQVFRGIAAVMVVLHHMNGSFSFYHNNHSPILSYLASVGKYGVDFFFVLSGFIITYSSFRYKGQIIEIKKYLINRIIRIYFPYIPIGILMLALYWQFGGYSNVERSISWKTSIFLIPDGKPALSVAWTLVHEVLFYLLFIIFFYSEKIWNVFIVLWIIVIMYFMIINVSLSNPWASAFLSPYNLEFVLGYLLAYGLKKGLKINYFLSVASFILFFFSFFYVVYSKVPLGPYVNNFIFSLGAFFLINTTVCYWNKSLKPNNLFMIIGNATYSIYLVHNPLQSAIIRFLPLSRNNRALFIFEILLVLLICCLIGFAYYVLIEKNGIKWVKNKIFRLS